jgi:S1-C subfamily serine protease
MCILAFCGGPVRGTSAERVTPVVRAVRKVMPTVVNISTERVVRVSDPFERYFNNFFAPHFRYFRKSIPLGSGIIVDDSGLVMTNYHVIQRASEVEVKLWDGHSYPGEVMAYDVTNDLCLLRLEGDLSKTKLHAVNFAVPDDLLLGETVVTVGNPFGLEHSVSIGVLSALNRSYREGDVTFNDVLQTDAAINPGNSGGPLINLDGDLIGINLAIQRDAEGIGFAIPLSRIERVLATWLLPSRFSLAQVGFVPETTVKDEATSVTVVEVLDDSPAAKAGLRKGDRILSCNGSAVARAIDLGKLLWRVQSGDTVLLKTDRADKVTITAASMTPEQLTQRRLGVRMQELSAPLRKALGLPDNLQGLAISDILPDSEFASRKLRWGDMIRRGDIIVQINGTNTGSMDDVFNVLKDTHSGIKIPVIVVAVDTLGERVSLSPIRIDIVLN